MPASERQSEDKKSVAGVVGADHGALSTEVKNHLHSAIANKAVRDLDPEGVVACCVITDCCKKRHLGRPDGTRNDSWIVDKGVTTHLMSRREQVVVLVELA